MKYKILSFVLVLAFISCNNDDDSGLPPSTSVNDFVWKALNLWYYWQAESPDLADNRFSSDVEYTQFLNAQQTDGLFYNLLYDYGNTDRFSWIVDDYEVLDNSFAGINLSFGMDYGLVYIESGSNLLLGYVQYVLPNSPAANAGFQRGDIFTRINGTPLTDSNYSQLLGQTSVTFGMAYLQDGTLIETNEQIPLTKTQISENPVYLSTVIESDGHKIGYLMYNGFRANYNDELNLAIGSLNAAGITDLVIDLRYNGGGSVQTAAYLGSMVTGQYAGQDFTKLTFNQKASSNNSTYKFENEGKVYNDDLEQVGTFNLQHLNFNRVYVLTTRGSASASEMLISCLKPYISVTTIGTKTYGKTVGSITLYDSPSTYYTTTENINTEHKWAMQPIVFEYRDAQNQSSPTMGISPDYEINEIQYLENMQPLGSLDEPLLNTAIGLITGVPRTVPAAAFTPHQLFKNAKSLEPFGTELYLDKGFKLNP
ncbi:MAG: S41 family peptidase [Moheibacter sp.]